MFSVVKLTKGIVISRGFPRLVKTCPTVGVWLCELFSTTLTRDGWQARLLVERSTIVEPKVGLVNWWWLSGGPVEDQFLVRKCERISDGDGKLCPGRDSELGSASLENDSTSKFSAPSGC